MAVKPVSAWISQRQRTHGMSRASPRVSYSAGAHVNVVGPMHAVGAPPVPCTLKAVLTPGWLKGDSPTRVEEEFAR